MGVEPQLGHETGRTLTRCLGDSLGRLGFREAFTRGVALAVFCRGGLAQWMGKRTLFGFVFGYLLGGALVC
jgi:hypothetical protein